LIAQIVKEHFDRPAAENSRALRRPFPQGYGDSDRG